MPGVAETLRAPTTVECAQCEVTELFAGSKLPMGWEFIGGRPYCAECAGRLGCELPAPGISCGRLLPIGPDGETSQYRGCRLGYEITHGLVGLRIHGGVCPPAGARDDPAQFIISGHELDQLISRLQIIQLELNATNQPRDF